MSLITKLVIIDTCIWEFEMRESGLVFSFKPMHEVSLLRLQYKLSRRGTQLEPNTSSNNILSMKKTTRSF